MDTDADTAADTRPKMAVARISAVLSTLTDEEFEGLKKLVAEETRRRLRPASRASVQGIV